MYNEKNNKNSHMKNFIIALILLPFVYACHYNTEKRYSELDINTLEFYTYNGEKISKDEIIALWNYRLQNKEKHKVVVVSIEI